jgi:arylsulfatase A
MHRIIDKKCFNERFMKKSILIGFFMLILTIGASRFAPAAEKPNIVLIYSDDQGFGDVSALNPNAKFQTPHLDRLVREGMTFTDGHCADTVCTPSRYGLLTGRYCWRTHLKRGVLGADAPCLVENGRTTLASLLRENGYQTAMIGKWHLGMQFVGETGKGRDWSKPFTDGPIEKGFDRFYGIPASMNYGILTYLNQDRITTPPTLWTRKKKGLVIHDRNSYRIAPPYDKNRGKNLLEVAPDFVDQKVLEVLTGKAIEWIQTAAKKEKPFFLYLPFTSPHKPVIPMDRFKGKSKCGAYGDFMIETDFRVGQILKTLDELRITKNTLLIFTSDNGPENTWKKRIEVYGHRSAGRYRGGKRSRYEGGHRVPFLIRWPAKIRAGSKCDVTVCQTDFLATISEMLDVKLPEKAGEDSFSFYSAMGGKKMSRGPMIHHSADGQFAIRMGDWKLIVNRKATRKKRKKKNRNVSENRYELYNLKQDPSETRDVSSRNTDRVKLMAATLERLKSATRSAPSKEYTP